MNCQNCNNQLPDDARFCTECGESAAYTPPEVYAPPTVYSPPATYSPPEKYAPPEGFEIDPDSRLYYRSMIDADGTQWVTWFDANTGTYEQNSYPTEPSAPLPMPQSPPQSTLLPPPLPTTDFAANATPPVKKKSKAIVLMIILPIVALLAGALFAFLQLGEFTLFQRDNPPEIEELHLNDGELAALWSPGSPPGVELPGPEETPDSDCCPPLANDLDETPEPDETLEPDEVSDEPEMPEVPENMYQEAPVSLNMELLSLLGQSNAYLRQINGDDGYMGIWYGSPMIEYSELRVSYPVAFEFAGDPWVVDEIWSRIMDGDLLSYYNNWPDDFIINMIYVWEGPYISNLHYLFNTELPLTLDNMMANFELEGEVNFIPVHEQGGDLNFGFDVWRGIFISGEYRVIAFFYMPNEEIMLLEAGVCLQN